MYSRILVAVDGSPASDAALRHAAALARETSALLRIVHVVDMGLTPLGSELAFDLSATTEARRKAGQAVVEAAAATASAASVQADTQMLETGAPTESLAEEIVEAASTWPADLIVMGTHGRPGLVRLVLGSVTNDVARRSTVPLLIVPTAPETRGD